MNDRLGAPAHSRSTVTGRLKSDIALAGHSQEFPHHFLPEDFVFTSWDELKPQCDRLLALNIESSEQLELYLLALSEVLGVVNEREALLFNAMCADMQQNSPKEAYSYFKNEIAPKFEEVKHALEGRYFESSFRLTLDNARYARFDTLLSGQCLIFQPSNLTLRAEDSNLNKDAQSVLGKLGAKFEGHLLTMKVLEEILKDPDRSRREAVWKLIMHERLGVQEQLDDIFSQMIAKRQQMAQNAGFNNFLDLNFKERARDYPPADCKNYHLAIEQCVVPALRKLAKDRASQLDLLTLRPWDSNADGSPLLKPFQTIDQLQSGIYRTLKGIDPEFAEMFSFMAANGLLDLANRPGKRMGGFMNPLMDSRLPFLFMNASSAEEDVRITIHEMGHSAHIFLCRSEPLFQYRDLDNMMDFTEVGSMAMELFSLPHLGNFYTGNDLRRAKHNQLEHSLQLLAFVSKLVSFEEWIYSNPNHNVNERSKKWVELDERFGLDANWHGLEKERGIWPIKPHFFGNPGYYFSYGVARLGALQLWAKSLEDPEHTLLLFKNALKLGASKSVPQLFEACGIKFDFSVATVEPLVKLVLGELDKSKL